MRCRGKDQGALRRLAIFWLITAAAGFAVAAAIAVILCLTVDNAGAPPAASDTPAPANAAP
jgi:hypothetical protein